MRLGSHLSLFVALTALATPAAAQQVFVVAAAPGPGVFSTQISVAVNAAADGDIVLVRDGLYNEIVTIDAKGITLAAEAGAGVTIRRVDVRNLASSQRVVVRGIEADANINENGLRLEGNAGSIWIEDCKLFGGFHVFNPPVFQPSAQPGATVTGCASVALLRCALSGGNSPSSLPFPGAPALLTSASNLFLADTVCVGSDGKNSTQPTYSGGEGGAGAFVYGGLLVATGSTFAGGNGGSGLLTFGGMGGNGLVLSATTAYALECVFIGGQGGGSPFGQVANGTPVFGALTILPGSARHFAAGSPAREGQISTWSFNGLPNESVAVLFGPIAYPVAPFPAFGGALLIDPATASGLFLGTLSPGGDLSVPVPIPFLSPTIAGTTVLVQSVFFDSPLTTVSLGPVSALVVLDQTL